MRGPTFETADVRFDDSHVEGDAMDGQRFPHRERQNADGRRPLWARLRLLGAKAAVLLLLPLALGLPHDHAAASGQPMWPWLLPFDTIRGWNYTQGPHQNSTALDFQPTDAGGKACTFISSAWVVAPTYGIAYWVPNGVEVCRPVAQWTVCWRLFHVTRDRIPNGTYVDTGDRVGKPGCCEDTGQGPQCQATAPHLHLEVKVDGTLQNIVGYSPGGWLVQSDGCIKKGTTVICPSTTSPKVLPRPLTDFNDDGLVNVLDFSMLLSRWSPDQDTRSMVDINNDKRVNVLDFSALLTNWGKVGVPIDPSGGAGPTITVGAASAVNGKVRVPVHASGSESTAFRGFNVHLRWDPNVFGFSDASAAGGLFDPATAACDGAIPDADGGGVEFACALRGETEPVSSGLLATFDLAPGPAGCSRLGLVSYGTPDNGDTLSGTLTVDTADPPLSQTNQYVGATTDEAGQPCTPPACLNEDSDNLCNEIDPDDDNDGFLDPVDFFPLDAGRAGDHDGDGIDSLTDDEDDGDGFSDSRENYLSTDPLDACPDGPSDDAWPLDVSKDGQITVVGDVLNFRDRIGARQGDPNWWQRLDFNADGAITVVGDALLYRGMIGESCT